MSTAFQDITPCSLLELFKGTYYFHLQGRGVSKAIDQEVSTRLHGVKSHSTVFFIVAAVRILNATKANTYVM
jgi:hypothetical protein